MLVVLWLLSKRQGWVENQKCDMTGGQEQMLSGFSSLMAQSLGYLRLQRYFKKTYLPIVELKYKIRVAEKIV